MWWSSPPTPTMRGRSAAPTTGWKTASPRTPARFRFDLAHWRRHRVFSVILVAARQLPHPAVHDEPVPPHQQHPLARVVQDHRHRAAPNPEYVLRKAHMVRKLDISQAHTDVRGVIHQPLAVDHPTCAGQSRTRHYRSRQQAPGGRGPDSDLRYTWRPVGMPGAVRVSTDSARGPGTTGKQPASIG
jgi:hypothetical protein